jgi:hypothetical protein
VSGGGGGAAEAYGFALLWRLCRRLGVPATPWGLRDQLAEAAARGKQGAFDLLTPCASLAPLHGVDEVPVGGDDEALVGPVLAASGARLLGVRLLGEDLLEVRFRFLDRAFACLVERGFAAGGGRGALPGRAGRSSLAGVPAGGAAGGHRRRQGHRHQACPADLP